MPQDVDRRTATDMRYSAEGLQHQLQRAAAAAAWGSLTSSFVFVWLRQRTFIYDARQRDGD